MHCFSTTGILLLSYWHSTPDGGCNQTEVLRDEAVTFRRATICHGHLIVATNHHTDILFPQQYITAKFYHTDILSDRIIKFFRCFKMSVCLAFFCLQRDISAVIILQIKGTVNGWKQDFPVWERDSWRQYYSKNRSNFSK